jgi:hypothetical protein
MLGRDQPISRSRSRSRSRSIKRNQTTSRSISRSRSRERESHQRDTLNLGYDVKCSIIERVNFKNMNDINSKYPIPEKITPENIKEAYRNIMFQYTIAAYTRPNIHDDFFIPLKRSYDKYSKLLGIIKKYSNIPDEVVLTETPNDDKSEARNCAICFENLTNLNIVKCSDVKSLGTVANACTTDACVRCHERLITQHREKIYQPTTAGNELPQYNCFNCVTPLDISRIEEKINFYKSLPQKEKLPKFDDVFEKVVKALIDLKEILDIDDETYQDKPDYKQVTGNIIWETNNPHEKIFQAEFGHHSVSYDTKFSDEEKTHYRSNWKNILEWHTEIRKVYLENMYIGWDENRETLYGFVKNKNSHNDYEYSYSEDAYDFLNYMKTCEIIGFKTKGKTHKEIMDNWAKISSVNNVNKIYFSYNNNNNFIPNQYYSTTSSTSPFYYIDPINYDLLYGKGAFYKKIYPNIENLKSVGFKYPNDNIIIHEVRSYIQRMKHMEKINELSWFENTCNSVYGLKGGRKSRKGERKSRKGERKSKKSKK